MRARLSQVLTDSLAIIAPIGMPEPSPLAVSRMSGSTPSCSQAHIFPVRPTPDCTSSRHQQDPVPVAERAQVAQEAGRRHDVAALALDRLDEDGGDVVRVELPREEVLLDATSMQPRVHCRLVGAELAAVAIGVRDVVHVGQQRPEAGVLARLAAR